MLVPPSPGRLASVLGWALAPCVLAGCTDPAGQFDDFGERVDARERRHAGQEQTVGEVQRGGCQPVTPAMLAGTYFYAFRSIIAQDTPLLALFELSPRAAAPSGDFELDVVYQPLSYADRRTPVGAASVSVMKVKADGSYTVDNFSVLTPGDANPALPGINFESVISLAGKLCGEENMPLASWCGTATGNVTLPVTVNVDGSTFGARRLSGEDYPPPAGSCAETEINE
jgi:hypothetical protein